METRIAHVRGRCDGVVGGGTPERSTLSRITVQNQQKIMAGRRETHLCDGSSGSAAAAAAAARQRNDGNGETRAKNTTTTTTTFPRTVDAISGKPRPIQQTIGVQIFNRIDTENKHRTLCTFVYLCLYVHENVRCIAQARARERISQLSKYFFFYFV